MNTYIDSVTRLNDGSYMVKFPWKDDHAPLPSNFQVCERRTRSLARRLIQTPTLLKSYNKIIKEQERKGFMEKVISEPMPNQVHYIPHHPVRSPVQPKFALSMTAVVECRKSIQVSMTVS